MAEYIFSDNQEDIEFYRLRLLEIETGEFSEDDIGTYVEGAKDPRSFTTSYATTLIVGTKT